MAVSLVWFGLLAVSIYAKVLSFRDMTTDVSSIYICERGNSFRDMVMDVGSIYKKKALIRDGVSMWT